LEHPEQFVAYSKAAAFPRELLHPAIAERVWAALARGDYADAVFFGFRSVEESVRQADKYADTDIGVDLMRKAFDAAKGLSRNRPTRNLNARRSLTCSLALSAHTKALSRIALSR
jgi:hypothetical protein